MLEGYRHVIRDHVFDKCWALDITWAEVEVMIDNGEVVEEHQFDNLKIKENRLLLAWARPLHLVYLVDHERRTVVYRAVYKPDLRHWKPGYRERRR